MMGAYHVFVLLDELSKRTKLDVKYLKYLLPNEFENAKNMLDELKKRREHSFCVLDYKNYYVVSQNEARVPTIHRIPLKLPAADPIELLGRAERGARSNAHTGCFCRLHVE